MSLIDKRALDIAFGDDPILPANDQIPVSENVIFEVPSQSSSGDRYVVNLERVTCECKYWRKHRDRCKHIAAARLVRSAATRGEEQPESTPHPYKNPAWYDAIKAREERSVYELLRCLGAMVPYATQE